MISMQKNVFFPLNREDERKSFYENRKHLIRIFSLKSQKTQDAAEFNGTVNRAPNNYLQTF